MLIATILIVMMAVVVPVALIGHLARPTRTQRFQHAARELGLTVRAADAFSASSMHGTIDGFLVKAEQGLESGTSYHGQISIIVGTRGVVPVTLYVTRRGVLGFQDVLTGDREFDQMFRVDGNPGIVSGFLTGEVRDRLRALAAYGPVRLEHGSVALWISSAVSEQKLSGIVHEVVAVARLLGDERTTIHSRMLSELKSAATLELAVNNFSRLISSRPPEDTARAAVDHAMTSKHRELLLLAVPHTRIPHVDRLREIFHEAADDDELRGAVLEALRHLYEPPPIELLTLLAEGGRRVRAAVAGYFGAEGKYRDERMLIELLGDRDEEVQLRAAEALERIGSTEAVEPLREWGRGLFLSERVKERAAAAVLAIQSRASGAARGQLSIAAREGGGGEVSLPKSTGELSVTGRGDE